MYILFKAERPIEGLGIRVGDVVKVTHGERPTLHRRLDMDLEDICRAADGGALKRFPRPDLRQTPRRRVGERNRRAFRYLVVLK